MYLSNDRLLTCEKFREVPSDRAAEFGPEVSKELDNVAKETVSVDPQHRLSLELGGR